MKLFEREDFPHTRKDLTADLIAGVTVAIVALPLAIGFGITSGLSATAGIATAIVAGFIAALLGGSRFQVSGPTGAMTVVLIPVISKHGITAIPVLGVMAAAILLLMALLRQGKPYECRTPGRIGTEHTNNRDRVRPSFPRALDGASALA